MKRKNIINKKIIIPAILILMLVVIGGVTYAYFTAGVEGNSEAKNAVADTGTMSLVYDGTSAVSLEGALPGAYHEINFSVENTGSLTTSYSIDLTNVVNTFLEPNDLVYMLEENGKKVIDWTVVPKNEESIVPAVAIEAGIKHEYKLTIHFKETGSNQNSNQGKVFSGKIQINSLNESNYLVANILSKASISTNEIDYKSLPTENAIYKTLDNDGETYYYRGMIDNNYVDLGTVYENDTPLYVVGLNGSTKTITYNSDRDILVTGICGSTTQSSFFGYNSEEECLADIQDFSKKTGDPLLWRIVRINGDGSIRLITDNTVGYSEYSNINEVEEKLAGYTYDNSFPNAGDGTPSTIKVYLDNWYASNLSNYNDYIITGNFCNDTSVGNTSDNTKNYNGYYRDKDSDPSLLCPETTLNYGGRYKLKVGLLTSDEAMMAGFIRVSNKATPNTSYLWQPEEFWTMTPRRFYHDYPDVFSVSYNGRITSIQITEEEEEYYAVRPVVNLDKNVKVEGNGTKTNPYKIITE